MKRSTVCFVVMVLVYSLHVVGAHASAFATASAGNAESPEGQDFEVGGTSASVNATSTDPQFGTATADGSVLGPSLTYTGFAASYVGPAWIANASLDWADLVYLTFPVDDVTGSIEELTVRFTASFSWDIESNGSYTIGFNGFGASYSTASGQQLDDFGGLAGPSGSAELIVTSSIETIDLDPDDNTQYIATVGSYLQLNGHAGSGDWQHGSFATAFATHSLALSEVVILDGETVIEPLVKYGADLEPQDTADFDDDGDVDGRDFLIWQRGFGMKSGAALGNGDSNADGDVDADDLGIWQDQFGESGHLASIASVPEPATTVLIAVAVCVIPTRRKRGG